jgi:valyl-tRNA synthetase
MRADGAPYAEEAAKAMHREVGVVAGRGDVDAINLVPDEYRGLDRYVARERSSPTSMPKALR